MARQLGLDTVRFEQPRFLPGERRADRRIANIADPADPVVEVWTPGASQPSRARDNVSVGGMAVLLAVTFEGLAEIPPEEE